MAMPDPFANSRILDKFPELRGKVPELMQRSGRNTVSDAGRFAGDPTREIGRLLDEMERARRGLSDISFEPTAQDIALQQRIQEALLAPALGRVSGGFGARGLSGSSLEAVQRAAMAGQIGLQSQQQLRDAAMQRAQFEQGRNLQLFNSLIGSIQGTTARGAPGTQLKKKKAGIGGVIGGAIGGIAGSFLGPVGTAIGSRIGSSIGGGGQTPEDPDPYGGHEDFYP